MRLAANDETIRFDPVYQGPLAQSQQDKFSKDPIKRFFMEVAPLIEMDEDVLDNFDLDEGSRVLAEFNDLPSEMINTREKVEAIREGKRQAAEEAAQQEAVEAGLQNAKTLSEADKNVGGQLSAQIPAGGASAILPA
jgi:hypothetical protein